MPVGQNRITYSTPAKRLANPVQVDKSLGVITIKLEPVNGFGYRVGIITIPVSMIDDNDCCSRYIDLIHWARLPKQYDTEGEVIAIDAYPTLTIEIEDCCQWQAFTVRMFGPDQPSGGSIFWDFRPSKLPVEEKTQNRMQSQNLIPPGAKLELSYEYWNGENRWEVPADLAYWCTCCFTGGWIKSINGVPGSQDVTYTIEIMGQDRICRPSDYLAYSVGQWVFIGRLSNECSDHSRLACQKACESDHTDQLMIIPLDIGGYTDGGTHQYIDYGLSEVPELFDTCLKAATIIEIDHAQNEADVDISGIGRLNGIPFFVHPPGQDTVEGASALFQADNLVTVLYHPEFRYIIGLGLVQYWEDWNGPNIATNHPWDLILYDYGAPEKSEITVYPADAPEYVGGWGSYVRVENGSIKLRCHGGPWGSDGYNNIYFYLRAQEDYPIFAPAGIMILGISHAESPGIDCNTTMYMYDSAGKDVFINITISSDENPNDWDGDFIHNLIEPVPTILSGTYTVNLTEIGLTFPILRTEFYVWSGTEDAVLEIDYIDFL